MWIEILENNNLLPEKWSGIKTSTRICGSHFEPQMYFPDRKRRQLQPHAFPTVLKDVYDDPNCKMLKDDLGKSNKDMLMCIIYCLPTNVIIM